MSRTKNTWVDTAWAQIVAGDHGGARAMAVNRIASADSSDVDDSTPGSRLVRGRSMARRAEEIAAAEELLAAIALLEGQYESAVSRAQQAIVRSAHFRLGAHLMAVTALRYAGTPELVESKLRIVVDNTEDIGVRAIALLELRTSESR